MSEATKQHHRQAHLVPQEVSGPHRRGSGRFLFQPVPRLSGPSHPAPTAMGEAGPWSDPGLLSFTSHGETLLLWAGPLSPPTPKSFN